MNLNAEQSQELAGAVVAYLRAQSLDEDAVRAIETGLGVPSLPLDTNELANKWEAVAKLQHKVDALESENAALRAQTPGKQPALSLNEWLPSSDPRLVLEGHRDRVCSVAIHPTWSILASACAAGEIKLWNLETGELERTVLAHTRPVLSIAFAPASHCLVSSSADMSVKVWDLRKQMANVRTLRGHEHTVSAVTCAVDLNSGLEYVFSASRDRTVRVWDLQTGLLQQTLHGHTDWVRAIAVTPDLRGGKQYLLSVASDRQARLQVAFTSDESSAECVVYKHHKNVVECCAIAPLNTAETLGEPGTAVVFATGGRDCRVLVYSSSASRPVRELVGHENWVQAVHFHPNGRHLISVGDDCQLIVWDLNTGSLISAAKVHEHFVTSLAWRNKTIVTGSMDQTVKVWQ